jgi:hypothetical protein
MKGIVNKDSNYSLYNIENYKKEFDCQVNVITQKYAELLVEYFKFITENIKIKKENLTKFIINRGLNTITHVFLHILFYTKNIDITYFHCQKSFYFYVEFVCQISEEEKSFLQLTTRDATLYVYKKTIFEINSECKKINDTLTIDTREKINIINSYVNLYKIYINKIIDSNVKNTTRYIELFQKITKSLNNLNNKDTIILLEKLVVKLSGKIIDIDYFFHINQEIVKKCIKTPNILSKYDAKILDNDFDTKVNDTIEKFTLWFTN